MNFSPRDFRNALGMFPTGVAVITSRAPNGHQIGITVNSFTSVSLDPPLISFSLAKSIGSLDHLLRGETFAVNVLTEGQSTTSTAFARANTDKWAGTTTRYGETDNPILDPSLAVFECARYATYEAGDHMIVLGRVLNYQVSETEAPLVFFRGRYRGVGALIEDR